jgi:hypothetical protein
MKNMAFDGVGLIWIAVHTPDPPSQEEWDAYLTGTRAFLERVGEDRARGLAFTEGGGPSFFQRQQLNAVLKGRAIPAVVVTSNAFVRGIVAALAIFNPKIKAVRPEAIGDGFRYLSLSETESKAVWRTVARLQAQLGLRSTGSTGSG